MVFLKNQILSILIPAMMIGCSGPSRPEKPSALNEEGVGSGESTAPIEQPQVQQGVVPSESGGSRARVGADIGTDETKEAANGCLGKGMFFDRQKNSGVGECTSFRLADIQCTREALIAIQETDQAKIQLGDIFSKSYEGNGFILDSCLHCPEESVDELKKLCEVNERFQKGTKVFFVKEDGDDLIVRGLRIPYQSKFLNE